MTSTRGIPHDLKNFMSVSAAIVDRRGTAPSVIALEPSFRRVPPQRRARRHVTAVTHHHHRSGTIPPLRPICCSNPSSLIPSAAAVRPLLAPLRKPSVLATALSSTSPTNFGHGTNTNAITIMRRTTSTTGFHLPLPVLYSRHQLPISSLRTVNTLLFRRNAACLPFTPNTFALHPSQRPLTVIPVASNTNASQQHLPHAATPVTPTPQSSSSSSSSPKSSPTSHPVIQVASARAITPMRRPRENASSFQEEQPMPSQRRSDLMAPQTTGFWSLIPYMAASAVILATAWLAKKRFVARIDRLIDEFGQVSVLYGTSPDAMHDIVSEYKRKLGPGVLRARMFTCYLQNLITDKAIVPTTIQDVAIVKRLLKLSDDRAITAVNKLAETLKDAPSLLGKLLFLSERIVAPEKTSGLTMTPLFPYSESTVADLQRNMLERCFKEFVNDEIEVNGLDEFPQPAAAALRLDPVDAQSLFDAVVMSRLRKKESEAAEMAAAIAEDAAKPNVSELDYPARSGQPAKAAVHAYQCSDCGYTLFPAAGREFKFYGDDFVCPACGAPKDKFADLNSEG